MIVNLTNMLSTIALIGLLVGPTVGVADGSDAYQACQDMKWKADKQAKKNCFRDLALSYEVVMANGSTDTDTSELEDEIAELEGKLEESEEDIAELEGKLEESEEGIAEIEEAHEAEIAELEAKLEESSTDTDTSDLEDEVAELEGKLEESEEEIAELERLREQCDEKLSELNDGSKYQLRVYMMDGIWRWVGGWTPIVMQLCKEGYELPGWAD